MEEIVTQRVKQILNKEALSVLAFSKRIGMAQTTVNNILIGKRSMSYDLISNIVNSDLNISAEWLLRGEGEMYRSESATIASDTEKNLNRLIQMLEDRIESLEEELATYKKQKNVG